MSGASRREIPTFAPAPASVPVCLSEGPGADFKAGLLVDIHYQDLWEQVET